MALRVEYSFALFNIYPFYICCKREESRSRITDDINIANLDITFDSNQNGNQNTQPMHMFHKGTIQWHI